MSSGLIKTGVQGAMIFVSQTTLAAPAQTTTLSSLSIATYGFYRLIIKYVSGGAAGSDLSLYMNGNVTANNYNNQRIAAVNAGISTAKNNNAIVLPSINNGGSVSQLIIDFALDSTTAHYYCIGLYEVNTTGNYTYISNVQLNAVSADITSITLSSSIANGIGTGTVLTLYRIGVS